MNLFERSILLAEIFALILCSSCRSNDYNQFSEVEKSWTKSFDAFVMNSPVCPRGKHVLVEGEKSFPRYGGSCFECKKPLGITETKINRFTQKRTTTIKKVYTCADICKYNVCDSCAKTNGLN